MTDLSALEAEQHVASTSQPLPRKKLGRAEFWLLIIMRIYVIVAVPVVAYAFIHALRAGAG